MSSATVAGADRLRYARRGCIRPEICFYSRCLSAVGHIYPYGMMENLPYVRTMRQEYNKQDSAFPAALQDRIKHTTVELGACWEYAFVNARRWCKLKRQ